MAPVPMHAPSRVMPNGSATARSLTPSTASNMISARLISPYLDVPAVDSVSLATQA